MLFFSLGLFALPITVSALHLGPGLGDSEGGRLLQERQNKLGDSARERLLREPGNKCRKLISDLPKGWPQPKMKYQFVIVTAVSMRAEGRNLLNWIEYHALVGVQHFFLFLDDDSIEWADETQASLVSSLKEHPELISITHVPEPYHECRDTYYLEQTRNYGNTVSRYIALLDTDEYLVPQHALRKNGAAMQWAGSVREALLGAAAQLPGRSLYIPRKEFGTGGRAEPSNETLIGTYNRWRKKYLWHDGCFSTPGKILVNTDVPFIFASQHVIYDAGTPKSSLSSLPDGTPMIDGSCNLPGHEFDEGAMPVFIHHYATKSLQECRAKRIKQSRESRWRGQVPEWWCSAFHPGSEHFHIAKDDVYDYWAMIEDKELLESNLVEELQKHRQFLSAPH